MYLWNTLLAETLHTNWTEWARASQVTHLKILFCWLWRPDKTIWNVCWCL